MAKKKDKPEFPGLVSAADALKIHHMLNAISGDSPGVDKINKLIGVRGLPKDLANPGKILQIKIGLKYASPPIWRRILMPSETSLEDLHSFIQRIMDWDGDHLHQFECQGHHLGSPYDEFLDKDYEGVRVGELLRTAKDKMEYLYDFGASWRHEILLEKILEPKKDQNYPFCTAGRQQAPEEYLDWDEEYEEERLDMVPFTVDGVNEVLAIFW